MYAAPGVGLAANQIGVQRRIFVYDIGDGPITIINPQIIETDGEWTYDEGCLSVPGLRGLVPRFNRLRYTGFDAAGHPIEREADGFHARVVQHECDHLIGRLYPTRMTDLTQFGFTSVLFPELDPNSDDD